MAFEYSRPGTRQKELDLQVTACVRCEGTVRRDGAKGEGFADGLTGSGLRVRGMSMRCHEGVFGLPVFGICGTESGAGLGKLIAVKPTFLAIP